MLRVELIRHGKTQGNLERRYVGRTDEPLCKEGIRELEKTRECLRETDESGAEEADIRGGRAAAVPLLFCSPMRRCLETAGYLYPGLVPVVIDGFRETDFGAFEYHTYEELKESAAYREWLASGGESGIPQGESRNAVRARIQEGWRQALALCGKQKARKAIFVIHGGTIMELLAWLGSPGRAYYDWQTANGTGYTGVWEEAVQQIRIERNWP